MRRGSDKKISGRWNARRLALLQQRRLVLLAMQLMGTGIALTGFPLHEYHISMHSQDMPCIPLPTREAAHDAAIIDWWLVSSSISFQYHVAHPVVTLCERASVPFCG